jgi:hypothetical protein
MRVKPSRQATPGEATAIGWLVVAVGTYFSLVGLAILPVPGGPRNLHAPLWIVLCCGLAFLLGGVAVLLQRLGGADPATGELPTGAPYWVRICQYLLGVAIFACFALVASWISFAPGERTFGGTVPTGPTLGRIVFGFSAVICWMGTIGYAVSGARKLKAIGAGSAAPAAALPPSGLAQQRERIIYALGNKPK